MRPVTQVNTDLSIMNMAMSINYNYFFLFAKNVINKKTEKHRHTGFQQQTTSFERIQSIYLDDINTHINDMFSCGAVISGS